MSCAITDVSTSSGLRRMTMTGDSGKATRNSGSQKLLSGILSVK